VKVRISYKGKLLSSNIQVADDLSSRLIGLMFRKEQKNADGLLLNPCNSIHTFFMRYALDIVFIDSHNKVVKIIRNLAPWRMTWIYFKSCKTLELPAGKLPLDLNEGDELEIRDV
jgi:uncharacterized protein